MQKPRRKKRGLCTHGKERNLFEKNHFSHEKRIPCLQAIEVDTCVELRGIKHDIVFSRLLKGLDENGNFSTENIENL